MIAPTHSACVQNFVCKSASSNIWQVEGKRLYVTIRFNIDESDIDLSYKKFLTGIY